jgi:hypothetical protein
VLKLKPISFALPEPSAWAAPQSYPGERIQR